MSDDTGPTQPTGSIADSITINDVGAQIPVSLITALIAGLTPGAAEPLTVDLGRLSIDIPTAVAQRLASDAVPDQHVSITFEHNAIVVSTAGVPPIRIVLPADGLKVTASPDGLRLGQ